MLLMQPGTNSIKTETCNLRLQPVIFNFVLVIYKLIQLINCNILIGNQLNIQMESKWKICKHFKVLQVFHWIGPSFEADVGQKRGIPA